MGLDVCVVVLTGNSAAFGDAKRPRAQSALVGTRHVELSQLPCGGSDKPVNSIVRVRVKTRDVAVVVNGTRKNIL